MRRALSLGPCTDSRQDCRARATRWACGGRWFLHQPRAAVRPCGRAAVGARRGRGSGVPEVRSRSRVATLSLLQGGGFWGGPGNPVAVSRLGAFHWGRKVVLAGITAAPPRGGTHAYPEPVATVRSLACHVSDGCCRYSAIPGPAAQPYPPLLSTWGHPLFRSGGQGVLVRTYSF